MESSRICLSSLGSTGTEFLYLDALNRQAMMMVVLLPCAVGLQTCHCLQQHTGIHSENHELGELYGSITVTR